MRKLLVPVLLAALCGCARAPELAEMARLESYAFAPASALESRIGAVPAPVLEFFRAEDQRPDYAAYLPSPGEKQLLLDYLALLPPEYEKVFKARCVGIYFIPGFIGNGVTNWVIGPENKVYFYIILNPAAFNSDLSETLTERERSCFRPEPGWDVTVSAGRKYKGLLYALAHEAAHGLDYAVGISPYTDDTMPEHFRPKQNLARNFFGGVWQDYRLPLPAADYPGRDKITFYGLGGGPKLDISGALPLYKALYAGQFVSLYGSRTWAEDLAELETFHFITERLRQPVRVRFVSPGGRYIMRPMDGKAADRAAVLRAFMEKINDAAL
jgi:hypothetical protein